MMLKDRLEQLIIGWTIANHPSGLEELTYLTANDFSSEYRDVWKIIPDAVNPEDVIMRLIRSGYQRITDIILLTDAHRPYPKIYVKHKILELINITRFDGYAYQLDRVKERYAKSGDALSFANEILQLSSATITNIEQTQRAESVQFSQSRDWFENIDKVESGFSFPSMTFLNTINIKTGRMLAVNGLMKQGKTTMALAMAFEREAIGERFSYISAEMTPEEIHEQFFAYKFNIPNSCFTDPKYLGRENRDKIRQYISEMPNKQPFRFEIHTALTLQQVHGFIRQHSSDGIKFIVLDYWQKIYAPEREFHNREEELSYISDQLKSYVLRYDVCLVVISQLNRSAFTEISAGNTAGSLGLNRDANFIFNIYKPSYLTSLKNKSVMDLGGLSVEFGKHDFVLNLEYGRKTRGGADALMTRERSGRLTVRWENYTQALDYDYVPEMAGF